MVLSCTVNQKKETGRYENLKMEKWKLDQVTSYRWVTQQFFNRNQISRLFLLFVKRKQSIALSWRVFGYWVLITRKHIINFVNLSFEFLLFNNYYSITCEELHQTPHIVFHPIYWYLETISATPPFCSHFSVLGYRMQHCLFWSLSSWGCRAVEILAFTWDSSHLYSEKTREIRDENENCFILPF